MVARLEEVVQKKILRRPIDVDEARSMMEELLGIQPERYAEIRYWHYMNWDSNLIEISYIPALEDGLKGLDGYTVCFEWGIIARKGIVRVLVWRDGWLIADIW